MKIRTRLTLQFTFIVAGIIVLFSLCIYYFASAYREYGFYMRLENKALTTASLLLKVKGLDEHLLKIIDRNTINALFNEKVLVYDNKDSLIYISIDNDSINVSKELIDRVRLEKKVKYQDGDYEVVGLLYTDKYDRFVVIATAYDKYGRNQVKYLQWILIIGFFISTGITVLMGGIYADRALKPMSDVVRQVDKITFSSLNLRVNEGNGSDEIAHLAITFNKMLERLQSAFEMQRSFVDNASHELRTPLTSVTGQIEVSLMNQRTDAEYRDVLQSVLQDVKNLSELINGLLDLAKANSDMSLISLRKIRIDELLWDTRSNLIKRKKDYTITIEFREIEDENNLTVIANEHLLKAALLNLMDNSCKYSHDKKVNILLSVKDAHIMIEFIDNGIGIDNTEIIKIFDPFYRSTNVKDIAGSGVGLTLTQRIISIHRGSINIYSELNKGTTVILTIPHLS